VHPASGRTVFHLATSVSIPLFEVELAAFAHQVRAGPTRHIVLVLDRAGWPDWACQCAAPRTRTCASALPACLFAGTAARRAFVAADQHHLG
jgi:hypothetical protein